MTEAPGDVWFNRDLPFLQWVVPNVDAKPFEGVNTQHVAEALGWPRERVVQATRSCEHVYVEVKWMMGGHARITDVTVAARQTVGLWPTAESVADRLLEAAEAMTQADIDEAERTRWQAFRDGAVAAGRDVLVQVAGAAIGIHLPR